MTQFKSISFIKDIQGKDIGRCKTPMLVPFQLWVIVAIVYNHLHKLFSNTTEAVIVAAEKSNTL